MRVRDTHRFAFGSYYIKCVKVGAELFVLLVLGRMCGCYHLGSNSCELQCV